jgi:hypothetical protein
LGSPVSATLAGFGILKHAETRHLATGAFAGRAGKWPGPLRKRMGGPPARGAASHLNKSDVAEIEAEVRAVLTEI